MSVLPQKGVSAKTVMSKLDRCPKDNGHTDYLHQHAILILGLPTQLILYGWTHPQNNQMQNLFLVIVVGYLISVNITSKSFSVGQRWCDTVCARGLGCLRQHAAIARVYRQYKLSPVTERCNDAFQFGNGQTEQATVTKTYPDFVTCIYRGSISQAVAKPNCPMLLSKAAMAERDTDLRVGRNALTLNTFGVTLPFAEVTVLVVGITDIDVSHCLDEWNRIPNWYKLSELGPWTLSVNTWSTTG